MPNINIKAYEGSIIYEAILFSIFSQIEYAKKLSIPWGISEASFNVKDLSGNYQYKSFGIPWLGLKRGLEDEKTIAPYASILAINLVPKKVLLNLKNMEKYKARGKYGFYEAIDFTQDRVNIEEGFSVIKTFMAHHEGLILLSINNLVNNNVMQKRFMHNEEIESISTLLQEKMPINPIITKKKKEKVKKSIYKTENEYLYETFEKQDLIFPNRNCISQDKYTICIDDKVEGFSKYKDIYINKYKETIDFSSGIFVYIKDRENQEVYKLGGKDKKYKGEIKFSKDRAKYHFNKKQLSIDLEIGISPIDSTEIRVLSIKNNDDKEKILEVSTSFEPVLSKIDAEYAHPAFNKLFLEAKYDKDVEGLIINRNIRENDSKIYLASILYTECEKIGELEYEIDRSKLFCQQISDIPEMIKLSTPFSNSDEITTDMEVAYRRTLRIKPNEKINCYILLSVNENKEDVKTQIIKYKNEEYIQNALEISKIRAIEENRYLRIKAKKEITYQKLLSFLMFENPIKKLRLKNINKKYSVKELWKYGISGDIPILMIEITDVNEANLLLDILEAYELYRIKNILIDLVIIDLEENVYEKSNLDVIDRIIAERQISYLKNVYAGIHILSKSDIEDIESLECMASVLIDGKKGSLKYIIEDMKNEYLESIKNIGDIKSPRKFLLDTNNIVKSEISVENLKYFNDYGGFLENSDGQNEYVILLNKNKRLKTVWSHVLANKDFGCIVTQNMGGFTFANNSRLNRISKWTNDKVLDLPGENIYIKDINYGDGINLGTSYLESEKDVVIKYGLGFADYIYNYLGLEIENTIFVPKENKIKVNKMKITNNTDEKRKLKIYYYISPCMGEDELKTNSNIKVTKENDNFLKATNFLESESKMQDVFVGSSCEISSYTGSKNYFIGSRQYIKTRSSKKSISRL